MSELNVSLLPWQQEVYGSPSRFNVIAAGRRTGKSRLAIWSMVIEALSLAGCDVYYVAPTQQQARKIIWKDLHDLGHSVIQSSHINNLEITLINGSTISLKGADRPETMRGTKLKFLVMDEYADMKPEVFEQILRPALSDLKGKALFIGTPMGRNHFYDLYQYGLLGDDPEWSSWHYTSYDNPFIDKEEIEAAKRSMSSYSFRQEFLASFEAMGSELFKEDWLVFSEEEPEGEYYIACDLAGFEDVSQTVKNKRLDDTAICVVKVSPDGKWWVKDIINGRWDLNTTAEKIFNAVRIYKPVMVGIEKGIARQAVISPLTDLMRRGQTFFRVEELTHGNKKKTDRIVWALQGRFENGFVTLNKGEWNTKFMDQLFQFPNPQVHDDLVDALSYIDQLSVVPYGTDFQFQEYEFLDEFTGY